MYRSTVFPSPYKMTLLALGTAVAVMVGLAPAQAADNKPSANAAPRSEVSASASASAAAGEQTERAAATLERHVRRAADGTLSLPPGLSAAAANVPSAAFQDITASMVLVNELVRAGELVTTPNLDVYAVAGAYSPQSTYSAFYWRWWGVEIHLSAYWTNKLVSGINVGASAASIGAIICTATGVCGIALAIVIAVVALGANIISFCSNSRGVVLKKTYAGPGWCHGH